VFGCAEGSGPCPASDVAVHGKLVATAIDFDNVFIQHLRALARKQQRCGSSDSRASTGHQRDLVFDSTCHDGPPRNQAGNGSSL
jgi:hypothetical protein